MKDRKDWGPADELANAYLTASGIAGILVVIFFLYLMVVNWL